MELSRKQKLRLNAVTGLARQLVSVVGAFIVPRLILKAFGSDVNGLVNSITNFLSVISLLESGISQVISSNLYKPLAENNNTEINRIFKSSQRFFSIIGMILLGFAVILSFVYPLLINKEFEFLYVFPLVLILALSLFAEYFIGFSYLIIVNADQRMYISQSIGILTSILSTFITVILIRAGCGIHIVKMSVVLINLMQPVGLKLYADRRYHIDHKIQLAGEPIKQKWNGLAQHIAFIVTTRADTVILTFFSTLANVSIYSVYNLVLSGLSGLLNSITGSIGPYFGNMIAKKEEGLQKSFDYIEWLLHTAVTFLFTVAGLLIVPFVSVYTRDISDAEYIEPLFAVVLTLAYTMRELRTPYTSVIFAAGHFKQTQWSSILEAVINITVSVAVVSRYGLVGVAVGTVCAMAYRTIYLVIYLSRNILFRPVTLFLRHFFVDALGTTVSVLLTVNRCHLCSSYMEWLLLAVKIGLFTAIALLAVNGLFYRKYLLRSIKILHWRKS